MLSVGQVCRGGLPSDGFLACLAGVLASPSKFSSLANATCDPRMSVESWRSVLRLELLLIQKWAIERLLMRVKVAEEVNSTLPTTVLVLLPRYGFALHALRRAVPFAALGIATTVAVSAESHAAAVLTIQPLLKSLGIEQALLVTHSDSVGAVREFAANAAPIFVTGSVATFSFLKSEYPSVKLVGATGRCCVIIGNRIADLERLKQCRVDATLPSSCSNYGASLLCKNGYKDESSATLIDGVAFSGGNERSSLGAHLRAIHPSVVFALSEDDGAEEDCMDISGYAVFKCGLDGVPSSRKGFARDPVCGWPGDYLV